MKTMRRFATLLTVLALCLVFGVQAFAAEPPRDNGENRPPEWEQNPPTETNATNETTATSETTSGTTETKAEPETQPARTENVAVEKVTIEIENSDGSLRFRSGDPEKYDISYSRDHYDVGEKVEVDVTLTAKNGYYFSGISKGDITLTGDKKNATKSDVSSSSSRIYVTIKISAVAGELDSPDDVRWSWSNFGYAEWEEVEGATGYTVSINGSTVSVGGNSCWVNLNSYLRAGKNNTFKVRATSSKSSVSKSDWSESDELWVDYSYNSYNNTSSVTSGYWSQNYDGTWCFINYNGTRYTSCWVSWKGSTYRIGANGIMLTGWNKIGGYWYYFDSSGAMYKNCYVISADGRYRYWLNSDGTMKTGYYDYYNGINFYVNSDGYANAC